jgi:hypothetical protein
MIECKEFRAWDLKDDFASKCHPADLQMLLRGSGEGGVERESESE